MAPCCPFGHWVVTLAIVLALSGRLSLAVFCPTSCKCSWIEDSLQVNCGHRGLLEYPDLQEIPVEHLDFSWNNFDIFPTYLAQYESLTYLDLSYNYIDHLEEEDLLGFDNLRTLKLGYNGISHWADLHAGTAFMNAPNLNYLSLQGNQLVTFNGDDSQHALVSASLNNLDLSNCNIRLAGGDVIIHNMPNLEYLNLNNNPLGNLASMPSMSLRVLQLRNCSLQRVQSTLLQSLPALEALQLSWNTALQMGPADRIASMTLNELDVSHCSLDSIDVSALPALEVLHMRGNMIHYLDGNTFANNSMLEKLDISRNALRALTPATFSGLKRLSSVDFSYNEIGRLDGYVFRNCDNLVSLNLSHNVIDKFSKIVSNSLREINLSWNEIIAIDGKALSGLTSIQILDLSNNLLSVLPDTLTSDTLQRLDISYCRLSTLHNSTFRHMPELAKLKLNGNRFTNAFPRLYFKSNKFLDSVWAGDNPWICNCQDGTFIEFFDFLTADPPRIKDRSSLRCASPTHNYGLSWEAACEKDWVPNGRSSKAEKVWSTIMICIFALAGLIFLFTCFQKFLAWRKKQINEDELRSNQEELRQIRRLNDRLLQEDARQDVSAIYENNNLPSYEDALRMPKPVRPVKSMVNLSSEASQRRGRLRKSRTNPEDAISEEEDIDLQIDHRTRFRSEEMLSNRDKERVQQMEPSRRTGHIAHNASGSRRFSIEDSRFPPAHLKSQNLQSAEQIGNFQGYEYSPYTRRKPKIAQIPPFKRASLRQDSVEFLTDPEFDATSKPSSPFARRKPKKDMPPGLPLAPAVEDHFGNAVKVNKSNTPPGSDFHVIIEPDIQSLKDGNISSDSSSEFDVVKGKRRIRKNSSSRRASGNFTAAAAAAGDTSDEEEPIVVVHRSMRETLF